LRAKAEKAWAIRSKLPGFGSGSMCLWWRRNLRIGQGSKSIGLTNGRDVNASAYSPDEGQVL